jgi:L-lactate dehydrogenase complex protein LldF
MNSNANAFPQDARAALDDAKLQLALANLKKGFQVKRADALHRLTDPDGLRDAGAAIRSNALAQLPELLERFERNLTMAGGHVHWARDAAEAREIITRILKERDAKTVTKGKSMVTEEIELNPFLEEQGITPIETDLGEYIIQLRKEPPSHIVAPAFHLRRQDVEESFRAAHGELEPSRVLDEGPALVAEARGILRQKFLAADAGITGANFLIAESGTAVIVTNEGNGDLTRLLPSTHIVVTGIEKIVPSANDAAVLLRLLTRAATGQDITSYVTFASGAKRNEDADGPNEFHVVLVDNGRSEIFGGPAHDVLKCIRCGACLNHCPVYGAIGGHAYGNVYPGPIGAALDPALDGIGNAHHLPNASSFCGRCEDVCPVKIPLTHIMRHWRNKAFEDGLNPAGLSWGLKIWGRLARSPRLYRVAAAFAARTIALLAGRKNTLGSAPIGRGWFKTRDLPVPPRKSFQTQWRARNK